MLSSVPSLTRHPDPPPRWTGPRHETAPAPRDCEKEPNIRSPRPPPKRHLKGSSPPRAFPPHSPAQIAHPSNELSKTPAAATNFAGAQPAECRPDTESTTRNEPPALSRVPLPLTKHPNFLAAPSR